MTYCNIIIYKKLWDTFTEGTFWLRPMGEARSRAGLISVPFPAILGIYHKRCFSRPERLQSRKLSLPSIEINQVPDARACKAKVSIRDSQVNNSLSTIY